MTEVKADIKSMKTQNNPIGTLQGKLNKLVTPAETNKGKGITGSYLPASSWPFGASVLDSKHALPLSNF